LKIRIAVFAVIFAILPALFLNGAEAVSVKFEILSGNAPIYQGDILVIKIGDKSAIEKFGIDVFGKTYRFNAQGLALIGISADQKPGKYDLVLIDLNNKETALQYQLFCHCCDCRTIEILLKDFGEERMKKFTPTEKQKKQRIREGEMMQAAYRSTGSLPNYIPGKFVSPLAEQDINKIAITDPFGIWRIYSKNKDDRDWHRGVDLRTGENAPISVVNSGVVILAEKNFLLEGNIVVVYHGFGIFSLYIHLSEIKVSTGQKVNAGQIVGISGSTGARTTGSHLHLGIKINDATVDPLKFIETANKYL